MQQSAVIPLHNRTLPRSIRLPGAIGHWHTLTVAYESVVWSATGGPPFALVVRCWLLEALSANPRARARPLEAEQRTISPTAHFALGMQPHGKKEKKKRKMGHETERPSFSGSTRFRGENFPIQPLASYHAALGRCLGFCMRGGGGGASMQSVRRGWRQLKKNKKKKKKNN
jgi:hypothetical protein